MKYRHSTQTRSGWWWPANTGEVIEAPRAGLAPIPLPAPLRVVAAVPDHRAAGASRTADAIGPTVLAGHHQPLRVWVLCLYFMGLNLSNRQIARGLGLDGSDVQAMTEQLRGGLAAKAPPVRLEGEVEIDEVYVVAGHKGNPDAVAKRGVPADAGG